MVELERLLPGFVATARRRHGPVGRLRADRLRLAPRARRRRLAATVPQPRPGRCPGRRARHQGGAAPARRHDGGDRPGRAARARGLLDLAVPGHRTPADRGHRPGRAGRPGPRPDRAHALQGRRPRLRQEGAGRSPHLHRRGPGRHVPPARQRRRRRRGHRRSTCAATTTTAGTRSSRTRSSPSRRAARGRWPTSAPAWSTCGVCSRSDRALRRPRSAAASRVRCTASPPAPATGCSPGDRGGAPPAWSSSRQARLMSARRSWCSTAEIRRVRSRPRLSPSRSCATNTDGVRPSSSNAVIVARLPPPAEYTASIDGCSARAPRTATSMVWSSPSVSVTSWTLRCGSQLGQRLAEPDLTLLLAAERRVAHGHQHAAGAAGPLGDQVGRRGPGGTVVDPDVRRLAARRARRSRT